MRLGYRLISGALGLYFKLFHKHRIYGLENLPKGAAILAPNHLSLFDPPIIGGSIREELHYLAKHELFEYRLLGPLIRYLNSHPVTETGTDLQSLKIVCRLLNQGEKVVIFPEGSRSVTGELLPLKTGVSMLALRCHAPIVPIYIKGTLEIWPMNQDWPSFKGDTSCTIGKPIYPDQYAEMKKHEGMNALTNELKEAMLKMQAESELSAPS